MSGTRTRAFIDELNAEYKATRVCLERIPESLYEFKPHPRSMNMGYLVLLVAQIPLWIKHMVIDGEIDFETFKQVTPKTTKEMLDHFEENIEAATKALESTNDENLQNEKFSLKRSGQLLYSAPKIVDVGTTINHWVHHRGQLTVYMRMNEIAIPSIYGPSGDDKNFSPAK
jgi:uncharacterized damage-inducible protein DinB